MLSLAIAVVSCFFIQSQMQLTTKTVGKQTKNCPQLTTYPGKKQLIFWFSKKIGLHTHRMALSRKMLPTRRGGSKNTAIFK